MVADASGIMGVIGKDHRGFLRGQMTLLCIKKSPKAMYAVYRILLLDLVRIALKCGSLLALGVVGVSGNAVFGGYDVTPPALNSTERLLPCGCQSQKASLLHA